MVMAVKRARSDDGDQPVVAALQDVGYFNAALFDQRLHAERHGQIVLQQRGGNQRTDGTDADVVDAGRILRRVGTAGLLVVIRVVEAAHAVVLRKTWGTPGIIAFALEFFDACGSGATWLAFALS